MFKIPITRREITLLLFCIIVFTIFYNFNNSGPLSRVLSNEKSNNVDNAGAKSIPADSLLGLQDALREDGRRLEDYTDELELKILGDWESDRRPLYDLGIAGTTVGKASIYWDKASEIPQTNWLAYVPGLTILENVYFFKGVIYIVAKDFTSLPSPSSITSSTGKLASKNAEVQKISIISEQEAQEAMGKWATKLRGSTWICTGSEIFGEGHSLLALYRAYSALSKESGSLAPPDRVYFTHIKAEDWLETGFDIRLSRLLFPTMNTFFLEDWMDLAEIEKPYYFERVVIADRTSALREASEEMTAPVESTGTNTKTAMSVQVQDHELSMSKAFLLPTYPNWFSSIRDGLLQSLSINQRTRSNAITYVSTQRRVNGPRLRQTDHAQLVSELQKLGDGNGWDVHIIELSDGAPEETSWRKQIAYALQSSVMLAVHGEFLGYSAFMKPTSPTPTVLEFFPRNTFSNNNEFVARAMGMDYIAWQDTQKYVAPHLPPVTDIPDDEMQVIKVDVNAIIRTIKEQMKRR